MATTRSNGSNAGWRNGPRGESRGTPPVILSPIWLPATLFGGALQAWRTAVQQRLRATLSINAAGLVRYLYGFPVALLLLGLYASLRDIPLPAMSPAFFGYAVAGGIAQIIATNLLLMAFGYRNFVVGTAYAKTEAVQGALLSAWLLGDKLTPLVWAGIAIGVLGVTVLSTGGERLSPAAVLRDVTQPAALCGLGAGFGFAVTSIFIRGATLKLATQDLVLRALLTLAVTSIAQTLLQGLYVIAREPQQIRAIFTSWRTSAQVGVLAALGSAGWFTGFATAPVALVRTVGQVEVVFTMLFSRFYLGEQLARGEVAGLLLVAAGVILAVLGA
jgi:drug/metabolite transporter (DMT)-like permease